MASDDPMLTAALAYAKRGWRVFPLSGKAPIAGTHGHRDACTDRKTIRAWWRKWPGANIGIACDSQHGPIVIDIDTHDPSRGERDGFEMLKHLDLPITREASSRKGRLHLYFDPMLDGTEVRRTIRVKFNGHKYALDVLGDGGYVVAPPSVHPDTGRKYKWLSKHQLAPLPQSILQLVQATRPDPKKPAPPLPELIGHGERDELLTSLAGSMRRRGASEEAILAALREENATRCHPPLPDKQLRKIARSIGAKDPAPKIENYTDLGNARRFIARHQRDLRSTPSARESWLLWDGPRWIADNTGEVERFAKDTVRSIYREAEQAGDPELRDQLLKHASKSESARAVRAMLELASTEPEIAITQDMLDADPWKFNTENGTLDLRTGKLLPHKRDDLITKLSPVEYDPDAKAPRWDRFLLEIMSGDAELVDFIQRAVGYAMTGDTSEQCLFFCYGQGSNGKSTFLEIIRELFGSYAQQSDFNSFMASRSDGPRNDLARMRGARLVTASEADGERGFDARIIKMLTGDDTIVARRLYEDFFEFRPQHKLFLAANHKPIVKEVTEAFWRRMRLIPFTATFTRDKRDKNLGATLRNEMSGILNWAVEGCRRWRAHGLMEPKAIRRATRDYRDENDLMSEFITQRCALDDSAWTSTPELYRVFSDWWVDTRGPRASPISMGWFSRLLGERPDLTPTKRQQIRGWRGIATMKEIQR